MSDVEEVLPKFTGKIFVGVVIVRELQCDREHVETIHRHPARSIGLCKLSARRQRPRAVEDTDIIQPKKTTFENIIPFGIFPIHPPRKIQQEFLKDPCKELSIAAAFHLFFYLVNAHGGPFMYRGIDTTESPLVRWDLPVRMHVP